MQEDRKCTNDSIRSTEDAKLVIELEEDNDNASNAISTSKASNESSSNILVSHSSTASTGASGSTSNTGTSDSTSNTGTSDSTSNTGTSDSTSNTGTSDSTSNTGTSGSNNSDNASASSTIFSTSVSGTVYSCTKSKDDIIEVVDLDNAENESPTKKIPQYIDTHLIIMGEKLMDIEVNHCQEMLKQQFPNLNGLRSTLQQDKPSNLPTTNWVQIVHCPSCDYWITGTTNGCNTGMVKIYDFVFRNIDEPTNRFCTNVFPVTLTSKSYAERKSK